MAVETNKTKWTDSFAKSIGVTTNPTGGEGGGDNPQTDKYDALEYTSYKDMLSSKIQASVARDQAQKYVGASLNNAGFGGQGMAESTRAGIMGTYNKAIMGADEQHQANLIDIENQRQEDLSAASEDDWQSAMTMLSQATSQEDLDYVKANFYDQMSDKQKKMFDYYYQSYSGSFSGVNDEFATYEDQANAIYDKAFGKDENGNEYVKNEIAAARYNYYMMQQKGYYIQGLSDGRENDDIDITVGSSSRDKGTEFDLRAGKAVSNAMSNNLTKAVGSEPKNGELVISGDKLYIYTKSGWKEVLDDHSKVADAIAAFKKLGIK